MPPVFSKEKQKIYCLFDSSRGEHRTSPCELHCLVGNPIQQMSRALADGNSDLALRALRAVNPFPGVTGRVCPHPCEENCNRGCLDESVSIRALERFSADHGNSPRLQPLQPSGKSVAVIGSGPSGLACAYFLTLLGHDVTVFEASPVAGGVPRLSIPDFRLPKDVVDKEVGLLLDLGVKIVTNTEVGRDIQMADLKERFSACVVAVGNRKERMLAIPGIEHALPAVSFLQSSNLARERMDGKRVVILGGGGVAFDCAFTARRLGASSIALVCLENRAIMKVTQAELAQADAEGIELHTGHLSAGIDMNVDGRLFVRADAVSDFAFDDKGELHVEKEDIPQLVLECDIVICASGLMPDISFLDGLELQRTGRGGIAVENGQSSLPGLFAVGECTMGPSLVSSVVRNARRTAFEIHAWLNDMPLGQAIDASIDENGLINVSYGVTKGEQHEVQFEEIANIYHYEKNQRSKTVFLTANETWMAFEELDKGLRDEDAAIEAARCMHCGHCQACGECVDSCPGLILELGDVSARVAYPDECWHCGCCRLACPGACISFKFPIHTFL